MKAMENWDLSNLYKGFDDEFKKDMQSFKEALEELTKFAKENFKQEGQESLEEKAKKLEGFIEQYNIFAGLAKTFYYCSLVLSCDSENIEAVKTRSKFTEILESQTVPMSLFEKYLNGTDIEELVKNSPILKEHKFILEDSANKASYKLSDVEELALAKGRMNGAAAFTSLHSQLTSTLDVEIEEDGEVKNMPLSVVRSLATSPSKEKRKLGFEAEMSAYPKIEKSIAAALNAIKGEAIAEADLRGYDSVLHMTLVESKMDKETLDALLGAMEESLPMFKKYFSHKAKLLGHTDGKLPFADIYAPVGDVEASALTFTKEEASKFVVDNFMKFSEDLGNFTKNAIENNWVDWYPRKGKVGGAFCMNIHPIKESRVMMNYNGSFDDVSTLAHEFGHAYHGDALKDARPLNSNYSMPIAEVASTFCETIVFNAALATATPAQKISILETSLLGASQVIVDIYSRFIFEDAVIEKRKEGNLSASELKELMASSQQKAYGDAIKDNHPYMWLNKGHYYSVKRNYYNFPYAYGLLFAKGLYSLYKKEGASFAPKYKELLTATGKNSLYEVGQIVGINVRDINFWRTSLKEIEQEIEEFTKLSL